MDQPCVSAAGFLRLDDALSERRNKQKFQPSAKTVSALMPHKPPTSNPEKVLSESSWNLYIEDSTAINAFVLPTKELFCTTGLIELLGNDERLLAAVLSHEISHVMERHAVENLGFYALSSVAFDIVRGVGYALTLSFPFIQDALAVSINFMNDTIAERAYSRKLEYEADKLGVQVLARAGYDPREASRLWSFLNEVEQEDAEQNQQYFCIHHSPLLRTHPTGIDRVKALDKELPKALDLYKKSAKAPLSKSTVVRQKPKETEGSK